MAGMGSGFLYSNSSNTAPAFSFNTAPAFSFSTAPASNNHSYGFSISSSASGGSQHYGFSTNNASGFPSSFGTTLSAASGGSSSFSAAFSASSGPGSINPSFKSSASTGSSLFGLFNNNASCSPSLFAADRSAASCGSSLFGTACSPPFKPSVFLGTSSTVTSASIPSSKSFSSMPTTAAASSTPLFGTPPETSFPFGIPASASSDPAVSFATLACNSVPSLGTPAAISSAKTTVAPSTFGATCASAAMTTASTAEQFSFSCAISSSSAQTSSTTTAAVAGTSGGSATTTITPSVCAPQMPSEIRGITIEEGYDSDSVDEAAGDVSEVTVLKAVPFQLMQRDENSCKSDPVSVEEWRTLIDTISTLVLDGGNDVRERVAERSGRHCDVFSPMVDLSLRCQELCNRYEEERQRREKLDAGILELSKEVHTLQNEIERLQMAAAERERLRNEERKRREELDAGSLEHSKEVHMLWNKIERLQMAAAERERRLPPGDWWGIWNREVQRADGEKKRADEERQLVKELTAELREAERKLGYYKSKYYGLSSQGTTTRGDSSGSRGHFSEHMEDPGERGEGFESHC